MTTPLTVQWITEAIYHANQGSFSRLYADTLFLFYIITAGAQPRPDRRKEERYAKIN